MKRDVVVRSGDATLRGWLFPASGVPLGITVVYLHGKAGHNGCLLVIWPDVERWIDDVAHSGRNATAYVCWGEYPAPGAEAARTAPPIRSSDVTASAMAGAVQRHHPGRRETVEIAGLVSAMPRRSMQERHG